MAQDLEVPGSIPGASKLHSAELRNSMEDKNNLTHGVLFGLKGQKNSWA